MADHGVGSEERDLRIGCLMGFLLIYMGYHLLDSIMAEETKQDKVLTPEQVELMDMRISQCEEESNKIWELIDQVSEDDNARLPFIPLFSRRRNVDEEEEYLDIQTEKVYAAHQDEYCLTACKGAGNDCMCIIAMTKHRA